MPTRNAMSGHNRWKRLTYTVMAPVYDLLAWPLEPMRRESIRRLDVQPGATVLMVGAGTGLDLAYLPAGAHVTAIDITPDMLARLKARARRLGLDVDARVMDGHAPEFATASFDRVILHLILAVIPDPVPCLREAARVLRPGGRAVIMDKFFPDDRPIPLALRALDPLLDCLGTRVTRQLGAILAGSGLEIVDRGPEWLRGFYRIVVLEKRRNLGGEAPQC